MLRSTAAALQGRDFPHLGRGRLPAAAVRATALLPGSARRTVYSLAGGAGGVPTGRLGDLDVEEVAGWVVSHYPQRRYPAVAIGSSNGAAVHLYTALGIPWLPQTLLVTVRHARADPDDAHRALEFGAQVAAPLLAANPQVSVHHMHDPNQDRLMVRWMTYLRLKRLALGAAYERFLTDHLAPGGTVLVVRDRSSWPVTRVADRQVFQFGARGGATADEYLRGGPRVSAFLHRHGVTRDRWDPPAPNTETAEAEWGLASQLADDVHRWAAAHGHPVRELVLDEPDELSGPVADLYRRWYAGRGLPTDRLLVESFVLHDPIAALRSARVPYWTLFPVRPSLDRARGWLGSTGPYQDTALLLFSHGVDSIGLARPGDWRDVLGQARLLGVDAHRFPVDFPAFARYGPALRRDRPHWPLPDEPLPLSVLDDVDAALTASRRRPES
ncbi:hypothetical protein E4P41_11655 [Geodermatophilus sp. DF01-2]|nr:hypothetical protein E4P41_11655 [Geodermatophilus sp. DF01_2]